MEWWTRQSQRLSVRFFVVGKLDQGCMPAARPPDEAARRLALVNLNILDTPAEARFDQIIYLAKLTFGVPIAYIAFVDQERQWIKAKGIGMTMRESSRDISFLRPRHPVGPDHDRARRLAGLPLCHQPAGAG